MIVKTDFHHRVFMVQFLLSACSTFRSDSASRVALGHFRSDTDEFELYLLSSEYRMSRGQPHGPRLFLGANPNGTGTPDQRKRIVANDHRGAFEFQLYGVVCERSDGAVFIGHAKNHARRVGSVGI